ncbi:MAG: MBL fold metallo-hydrolase, partial [Candidatus Bathyarchaeia archaeon]
MSKANAIRNLFTSPLGIDEVAFLYLGYSGVIIRTYKHTLVVDPADLLNVEEIYEQGSIHLLLFTHSHGDHYSLRPTLGIFKATGVPIIAESLVASDLMGKVPRDKLVAATPGKTYTFGEIHVDVIQGIHRGPINLYRIGVDKIRIFHAGDSGYVPLRDYPADLAFLPTGSPRFTQTLSSRRACAAGRRVAAPWHRPRRDGA